MATNGRHNRDLRRLRRHSETSTQDRYSMARVSGIRAQNQRAASVCQYCAIQWLGAALCQNAAVRTWIDEYPRCLRLNVRDGRSCGKICTTGATSLPNCDCDRPCRNRRREECVDLGWTPVKKRQPISGITYRQKTQVNPAALDRCWKGQRRSNDPSH